MAMLLGIPAFSCSHKRAHTTATARWFYASIPSCYLQSLLVTSSSECLMPSDAVDPSLLACKKQKVHFSEFLLLNCELQCTQL